jgi:hypothetical protein
VRRNRRSPAQGKVTKMEPWYSPSVLVQIGLLVIGFFYTLFARRQWLVACTPIPRQL